MSDAKLTVRPARAAEADLLAEFQAHLARESEGLEIERRSLGRGVRAVFDDPSLGQYWVADLDGEVAGCLLVTREWSDWRNGTVLWIQSAYVRPSCRRRGVFHALYEHLRHRVATSPDVKGIRLYVDHGNAGARRTYESLGMTHDHYVLYEWIK